MGELGSVTEERFEVEWVTELSRGIERLRDGGVGAAVLDLNLPDSKGVETFDKLFQAAPGVPILILSDADTEGEARQAVQRGAQDYLLKEQADGYRLRRTVRTIMDRWAAEAVCRENALATITLDSIGEGVVRTDLCGNVTYLNGFAEKMSGWFREEALGRPVADVLRLVDSVSGVVLPNVVVIVTQGDKSAMATTKCTNCTLIRRDGLEFGIENRVAIIHDQDGDTIGAVISFRDVSRARAASLEMSRVAQHDVLTQLPNRTLFDDRLTQAISLAERQNKQLAVLFVDVDQFKRINDTLGHAVGDNLLRSVAGRLTACIRRTDTVSRLGGDEFLILLSQVEHAEGAAVTARKILRAMASPHIIDNKSLDINVSIGGSTYPADGQDAESLVSQADVAMYEAKQHGRNSYQSFRTDMTARLAKRVLLEADLRSALGRNEFLLHYQPKIDLQTCQVTGMEALIRWQHPERGMLLPESFVPIAEECGLILHIGQWVLVEALQTSPRVERFGVRGCTDFGERVSGRIPVQGFSVRSSGRVDRYWDGTAKSRAGTNRDRVDAGRGVCCCYITRAEGDGGAGGHRRLWYGLLQLYLSAAFSSGHYESRSIVRAGDYSGSRGVNPCRRDDQYRKKSEAASRCSRSGNRFAARLPSAPRMRRGARLLFQPSRCGRAGSEPV